MSNIKPVSLSWIQAQAYLKKAYALEFSIENCVEKTTLRPCSAILAEEEIVLVYNGYQKWERLIIVEKESSGISQFISATLHASECQMVITYHDVSRGWESKLTINFLNKYLPTID